MILDKITWLSEDSDSDSEDEDFDIESKCRITGFLRTFIEAGMIIFYYKSWAGKDLTQNCYPRVTASHWIDVMGCSALYMWGVVLLVLKIHFTYVTK